MQDISPAGPPLPTRQIMNQWWRDITFVHWRLDPARAAALMPAGVRPDLHDGSAWVGLIPFRMVDAGLGRRGPIPWLGTFLETNVRLYSVDERGRRGVVFLSLDCDRLPVVAAANASFRVPYQFARLSYGRQGNRISYAARRRTGSHPASRLDVEVGDPVTEPGDLEHFLTARFGLHTRALGCTWWVPNTHEPWPLEQATVSALEDELVAAAGLPGVVDSAPDSVLFSTGIRTTFGLPQRL